MIFKPEIGRIPGGLRIPQGSIWGSHATEEGLLFWGEHLENWGSGFSYVVQTHTISLCVPPASWHWQVGGPVGMVFPATLPTELLVPNTSQPKNQFLRKCRKDLQRGEFDQWRLVKHWTLAERSLSREEYCHKLTEVIHESSGTGRSPLYSQNE